MGLEEAVAQNVQTGHPQRFYTYFGCSAEQLTQRKKYSYVVNNREYNFCDVLFLYHPQSVCHRDSESTP